MSKLEQVKAEIERKIKIYEAKLSELNKHQSIRNSYKCGHCAGKVDTLKYLLYYINTLQDE